LKSKFLNSSCKDAISVRRSRRVDEKRRKEEKEKISFISASSAVRQKNKSSIQNIK
jgi:hypothetical protein